MKELRERIRGFWNKKPCGTFGTVPDERGAEYFRKIRDRRYRLEPFVLDFIDALNVQSKRVLEIGCGVGTDGVELARRGADYVAVDTSDVSLCLAQENFRVNGQNGKFLNISAEELPFPHNSFDVIYSWGVLHHAADMGKTIAETYRVLKPGGRFCIMLYNKFSLVGLQLYLRYGLLRFKPFYSLDRLFAEHHESPGTKAITDGEARKLFDRFLDVKIENLVTPYDTRISRNIFLPRFFRRFVPGKLGFFKVIRGRK